MNKHFSLLLRACMHVCNHRMCGVYVYFCVHHWCPASCTTMFTDLPWLYLADCLLLCAHHQCSHHCFVHSCVFAGVCMSRLQQPRWQLLLLAQSVIPSPLLRRTSCSLLQTTAATVIFIMCLYVPSLCLVCCHCVSLHLAVAYVCK
jgi:hypothetical protein